MAGSSGSRAGATGVEAVGDRGREIPAYRHVTVYESRLLDAVRKLPESKRRLLVEFLS